MNEYGFLDLGNGKMMPLKPAPLETYLPSWLIHDVRLDVNGKHVVIKHPNVLINHTDKTIEISKGEENES